MDCPRCGGPLSGYALGESRAVVCEDCGYAGIPADHRGGYGDSESWSEALRRFRERQRARREREEGVALEVGETIYRVAPETAERYRGLTGKQQAVICELVAEPDPTDPDRSHREIAEAAGVGRSYAGEIEREYGDLAAAIAKAEVV